jgi:hypothetical protein
VIVMIARGLSRTCVSHPIVDVAVNGGLIRKRVEGWRHPDEELYCLWTSEGVTKQLRRGYPRLPVDLL